MKTAISVPDDTFEQVDRRAAELGVSRSQFYATAATRYLEELDRSSLTARINDALDLVGEDDDSAAAVAHGRGRLAQDEDW
ncbi:MAG: ribbon-helix-helix protein, CopG family [Mycobacteriales bacterium]|nr:ribbon-helix-helix protein, CopG family [Mycobacteriales bacterium]